MFRKQVDPKMAAITMVVTLVAIQWVYWTLLVKPPEAAEPGPIAGGAVPPQIPIILGYEAVSVENWVGGQPGAVDGAAWQAQLSGPNALAAAADGSLVVADSRNHCIRAISPIGHVTTLAGGDSGGTGGDAVGPAASARFRYPSGVAVGKDGAIYIADTGNHRLCVLKDGSVRVFVAKFRSPGPLQFDAAGRLWGADLENRAVRMISPAGAVSAPAPPPEIRATLGALFQAPPETVSGFEVTADSPAPSDFKSGRRSHGAVLPNGVRIFGDTTNHALMMQHPGQIPVLLAGRISEEAKAPDSIEGTGNRCSFATPAAVLARPDGLVYVADYDGNCIRRVRVPPDLLR